MDITPTIPKVKMLDSAGLNAPKRLAKLHCRVELGGANHVIAQAQLIEICETLRNDPSDVVRHEAAFLLGDLQREQRLAEPVLVMEVLITALKTDKSILVVHEIALSLSHFPSEETVEELIRAAMCRSVPEVTSSVQYALTEMLNRR